MTEVIMDDAWYDARLCDGSNTAWIEILTADRPALRRQAAFYVARSRVLTQADSLEIVTATQAKIWVKRATIHGPAISYYGYRWITCERSMIDVFRTRKKVREHEIVPSGKDGDQADIADLAMAGDTESEVIKKDLLDRVHRYLAMEANEQDREILTLYRIGLTRKQIAARLGIEEETAKKRLARAFERARRYFAAAGIARLVK